MSEIKKIKVMQVSSGISPEGIGTFILNTYENIDKEKIDISFALATKWKQFYEPRVINQGGKVYRTAEIGEGLLGIIKHFINLIKILRREGPFDVMHSHMDFLNGVNVLAAFIAGVPNRISHAHLAVNKEYTSFQKNIYNITMKMLIQLFATQKLGCSEAANNYMNNIQWTRNKSKVVFNGIDLRRFSNRNKKQIVIKDLNLNPNKLNFITIGRIDDQKNPFFIVEVIRSLKKIRSNIHLYWVGSGSLENDVKQLVNKYDLQCTISFLGVRRDVAEILTCMDFMIFPSKFEGLGIVLLEAQATGIPCFISDKIPPEADLGLCTILPLNEDEKIWAQKINNLIVTKTYNNKLNEDVLKKFDIKNTATTLENIYAGN